jgi:DNA-binding XRE family transcriptional regulator
MRPQLSQRQFPAESSHTRFIPHDSLRGDIMFKLKTTLGTNNICGANLIRLRHERGISQRQLAKNMQIAGYDVDHHFIRRIENGERFVTDIELVALAKVLQVEITDLIDPAIPVAVQKD